MTQDLNNILNQLYPKLEDYLISQGVKINNNGFFCCIHPDHPDKHPSSSLNYGNGEYEGRVFHCFSGKGHDGNIFTAAHWLEQMPLTGKDFWTITVKELCRRYDIAYSPIQIDEETRRMYEAYRAVNDAATIIKNMAVDGDELKNHVGINHLKERGFTDDTIKSYHIGVLTSFKEYEEAMTKLGHTDIDILTSLGLMSKKVFNRDGFIIPVKDKKGKTVGFVNRNCRIKPNDHTNEKYVNSPNTSLYKKGSILYGYERVKNLPGPLYIVEGYLDVMYLRQCGLNKVCAIGATVLTETHIEMLFDENPDIIMCLDGDKAGRDGITMAIERLSPYKKINLRIIDLPNDSDPDSYVHDFGIDNFKNLATVSPFTWTLEHASYSEDMTTIAKKIIPTIAALESNIDRIEKIRELSKYTALDEADIRRDVDALVNKRDDKFLTEVSNINNFVQVQLSRRKPSDTKRILADAILKLETLETKHNGGKDIRFEGTKRLELLKRKIDQGDYKEGLQAPNFRSITKLLDGIPYWGNLTYLAGRPSAGKTALLTALSSDIINANRDAAIFYMSIDDSFDFLTTKMMAVRSGLSTSQIRQYAILDPDKKNLVDEAYDWIRSISDRFIIADSNDGNSLNTVESHMNWFCKEYPKHKRLFLLDNFHKLSLDTKGQNKKMDSLSDASSFLKTLSQTSDTHIISTAELRKLANERDRPQRSDLLGTGKLDYDADIIGLVHNDMQVNEDTRILHRREVNGEMVKMPIIEVGFAKNKINGQTGCCTYKYDKINMGFETLNSSEFKAMKQSMAQRSITSNAKW